MADGKIETKLVKEPVDAEPETKAVENVKLLAGVTVGGTELGTSDGDQALTGGFDLGAEYNRYVSNSVYLGAGLSIQGVWGGEEVSSYYSEPVTATVDPFPTVPDSEQYNGKQYKKNNLGHLIFTPRVSAGYDFGGVKVGVNVGLAVNRFYDEARAVVTHFDTSGNEVLTDGQDSISPDLGVMGSASIYAEVNIPETALAVRGTGTYSSGDVDTLSSGWSMPDGKARGAKDYRATVDLVWRIGSDGTDSAAPTSSAMDATGAQAILDAEYKAFMEANVEVLTTAGITKVTARKFQAATYDDEKLAALTTNWDGSGDRVEGWYYSVSIVGATKDMEVTLGAGETFASFSQLLATAKARAEGGFEATTKAKIVAKDGDAKEDGKAKDKKEEVKEDVKEGK